MARLINLDDAVDAMKKSICGDTYEVDKAIEAIESIPTVEAIPIEWIEKYVESCPGMFKKDMRWIEIMVSWWKSEQEKPNETD